VTLVLDTTVGGASSNSYLTQAAATSYFEGRFDADDWTDAGTGDKDIALAMATSRLEQERYVGSPVSTTQRLQWPRANVPDLAGSYYITTAIPRFVQEACCELALTLLSDPTALQDSGLEGFDSAQVGPLNVTVRHGRKAGALPQNVLRLLADLRLPTGTSLAVVRG
jgi:hypothetical protein